MVSRENVGDVVKLEQQLHSNSLVKCYGNWGDFSLIIGIDFIIILLIIFSQLII